MTQAKIRTSQWTANSKNQSKQKLGITKESKKSSAKKEKQEKNDVTTNKKGDFHLREQKKNLIDSKNH